MAFLDDDVAVDPGWLRAVREAWATTPHVGAVTGLILPAALDTAAQLLVQAYGGFDKGFSRRVFDLDAHRLDHPLYPYLVGAYGSGANAVFDRARLLRLGGFDERLGPGTRTRSGEDLDVLLRTVLDGAAVVYEPAALVRHHHRDDYAGLRRMAYDYGVGLSALFVKHLVSSPRALLAIGRRLPAGLALLLRPGSDRNANRREAAYPAELTVARAARRRRGPAGVRPQPPVAAAAGPRRAPRRRRPTAGIGAARHPPVVQGVGDRREGRVGEVVRVAEDRRVAGVARPDGRRGGRRSGRSTSPGSRGRGPAGGPVALAEHRPADRVAGPVRLRHRHVRARASAARWVSRGSVGVGVARNPPSRSSAVGLK